jgi:hypothetical protein
MTSQTRTDTRQHYSPSASVQVVHAMAPAVQAILVVAVVLFSGVATFAAVKASIAERESRLQRLEVDEMKVALQVQGIKVHEGTTP